MYKITMKKSGKSRNLTESEFQALEAENRAHLYTVEPLKSEKVKEAKPSKEASPQQAETETNDTEINDN